MSFKMSLGHSGCLANIGDILVCIDDTGINSIKCGELYVANGFTKGGMIKIDGSQTGVKPSRFMIVSQPNVSKLESGNIVRCTNVLGEKSLELNQYYQIVTGGDYVTIRSIDFSNGFGKIVYGKNLDGAYCITRFYKIFDKLF